MIKCTIIRNPWFIKKKKSHSEVGSNLALPLSITTVSFYANLPYIGTEASSNVSHSSSAGDGESDSHSFSYCATLPFNKSLGFSMYFEPECLFLLPKKTCSAYRDLSFDSKAN